ncbi:MAG: hypothetical protein ACK5PS_16310 [Desulfopila sp.]
MSRAESDDSKSETKGPPVSDESIVKIAKEITVKFIEVGRITPASFARDFTDIYSTIAAAVEKRSQ